MKTVPLLWICLLTFNLKGYSSANESSCNDSPQTSSATKKKGFVKSIQQRSKCLLDKKKEEALGLCPNKFILINANTHNIGQIEQFSENGQLFINPTKNLSLQTANRVGSKIVQRYFNDIGFGVAVDKTSEVYNLDVRTDQNFLDRRNFTREVYYIDNYNYFSDEYDNLISAKRLTGFDCWDQGSCEQFNAVVSTFSTDHKLLDQDYSLDKSTLIKVNSVKSVLTSNSTYRSAPAMSYYREVENMSLELDNPILKKLDLVFGHKLVFHSDWNMTPQNSIDLDGDVIKSPGFRLKKQIKLLRSNGFVLCGQK